MNYETLWNGVELLWESGQFRLGTDSVVCADFARFSKHDKIADLGCGSGAIALMLLAGDPTLQITGIELQEKAALLAEKNAAHNGLAFSVIHGDLREIRTLLPAGSMDGCVSNPPYFPVGSGLTGALSQARSEETCSLSQLVQAAAWLLRTGGRFTLVHRPERLAELIFELKSRQLEPKRLCFTRHSPEKPVNLVLLEARKGGNPGLRIENELVFFQKNGEKTADFAKLYHREE